MKNKNYNIWWGPPKKFSTKFDERKISWLELFYDLVYVIAISHITKHLAEHPDFSSILNYVYLFAMIFWGWSNGSLYHDLHGSPGIRTRFMTLWQMMAVAALGVALDSPHDQFLVRTSICFAVLQGFITYLWWSVGIYDKNHRKLSVPYVACYFIGFVLLIILLYVPESYVGSILIALLILNHLPPFLNQRRLAQRHAEFNLSMSMVERLGLLTIIVFGENILGLVNGMAAAQNMNAGTWLSFALGILIVFALWWIFFALVADRECKHGFLKGQTFVFLYIPTLASLGMVGATFSVLLAQISETNETTQFVRSIFGTGLGLFLLSVLGITRMLIYPEDYNQAKRILQPFLLIAALSFIFITFVLTGISLLYLFLIIFIILLAIIVVITRNWFVVQLQHIADGTEQSQTQDLT